MISIFTSSFNHGAFLPEAIESVLNQSYEDFEYLIYDDGSTDDTWQTILKYADQDKRIVPIKLDKQKNVGVVINRSFQFFLGDAWVWLPADDKLAPNLLQEKLDWSKKFPDTIFYSYGFYMNNKGKTYKELILPCIEPKTFREEMKTTCKIGLTGVWIPRNIIDLVGLFPEHLNYSEDFYWILQACKAGVDFRCIPKCLYYKRKHQNSITGRNQKQIIKNINNIRKEIGWV